MSSDNSFNYERERYSQRRPPTNIASKPQSARMAQNRLSRVPSNTNLEPANYNHSISRTEHVSDSRDTIVRDSRASASTISSKHSSSSGVTSLSSARTSTSSQSHSVIGTGTSSNQPYPVMSGSSSGTNSTISTGNSTIGSGGGIKAGTTTTSQHTSIPFSSSNNPPSPTPTATPYSTPPQHFNPAFNSNPASSNRPYIPKTGPSVVASIPENSRIRHPTQEEYKYQQQHQLQQQQQNRHARQNSMNSASGRKPSQVSSSGSVSGVSRHQSTSQSSTGRNPSGSAASGGSDLWSTFFHFSSHTKPSDSLIYALTRKEAWMQYNKANIPGKNMDIIELWTIMSLRFMLKNRLLFSPQSKQLKSSTSSTSGNMPPSSSTTTSSRSSRILDIHGIFKAPWGWEVAMENPESMVYGYQFDHGTGMGQNALKDGPQNYTTVIGSTLMSLPFEDGFFDVVTCKSLWYFLQVFQWEDVFKEIFRVLKPGGAIELVVCDYDIVNRGSPDEFWWNRLLEGVNRRNLDPYPSAHTPRRLSAAGFVDVNRAILAIPRGWPGQLGHMTDFMSMYYSDSMFSYFADLTPSEMDMFRSSMAKTSEDESMTASVVTLCYATKPMD